MICLNVPLSSLLSVYLYLGSLPPWLCVAPSVASVSGVGKEGVSASGLRRAGQRNAAGAGRLKAPGAACRPPPPSCLFIFLSVKEPYFVSQTSVSIFISPLSNPAALILIQGALQCYFNTSFENICNSIYWQKLERL